jgi:hypothetical protein
LSRSELKKHTKLGDNKDFSHIYHIPDNKIAKTGPSVTPSASAMRLAREKGVSAPTVSDVYQDPETTWWVVAMEKIDGISLKVKCDILTKEGEEISSATSRTERRGCDQAGQEANIGSVDMTGVNDSLFLSRYSGSFVNETEFTAGLVQSLSAREGGRWIQLLSQFLLSWPGHRSSSSLWEA